MYNKCHKKRYISWFHDNYTFLNKKMTLLSPATAFSSDFQKKFSYFNQIVVNKIFKTGVTQKIIVDLDTTQHFIANCNFIYNFYDNYLSTRLN